MDSGHHAYTGSSGSVVAAIAPWNFPLMLESWKVTGKTIAGAAAANLVPVSLELGGKGANIVFDDADLDNAVAWSIRAICRRGPGLPGRVAAERHGLHPGPVPRTGLRRTEGRNGLQLLLRPRPARPVGGDGDSGIGREGGTFSREFFTEPKAVVMPLSEPDRRSSPAGSV